MHIYHSFEEDSCLKSNLHERMPRTIAVRPKRRGIIFVSSVNKRNAYVNQIHGQNQSRASSESLPLSSSNKIRSTRQQREGRSLTRDMDELFLNPTQMASTHRQPTIPKLFTSLPPIRDPLVTETSVVQDETVQSCLPFLAGAGGSKSPSDFNAYGLPHLERRQHIRFLHTSLRDLPSGFVGYDASRPWIVYWALTGLALLGEDVSVYRERYWQ